MSPELEERLAASRILVTSRLTLVESARALHRLRQAGTVSETRLSDAARALDALWARCEIWELTPAVCELASQVVPARPVRALDALHLATYLLARRRLGDVELVSADQRLLEAAGSV
jgi:predicted nucleic acid-binding protein